MQPIFIILLLHCSALLVTSEDTPGTKDLGEDDYDDLERKHRKKKKHQNNPCYGGYGRTFGEKFGSNTYVSAPVTNYFFGCGGGTPIAPAAPVYAYPVGVGGQYGHGHGGHSHGGHSHGGHGHGGHGHGGHGHGGHGGHGSYGGGYGGPNFNYDPGYNPGYNQPYYNQYQNQFNRPLQNVVSAAASGFGNAFANYLNRPRKFNKQVNQYLKPLYNLF